MLVQTCRAVCCKKSHTSKKKGSQGVDHSFSIELNWQAPFDLSVRDQRWISVSHLIGIMLCSIVRAAIDQTLR